MSVRPHPKQKTDTNYSSTWIIDFYPNGAAGKRERIPIKTTLAKALEIEASWRTQNKKATTLVCPKISEAIPHFIEHYKLDHQPKGTERTVRSLRIVVQFFGKYQFTSLSKQLIEEYKRQRLVTVKPTTINKELSALAMLCKWANDMEYCEEIKVKRFPPKLVRAPIPDIPGKEVITRLIESMPWPKQGLFWCMYYGGLRSAEAKGLSAEKINLAMGVMLIIGKGNKERVVPVIDELKEILERRVREVRTGLLWATPKGKQMGDLREIIKWAKKRTGITAHITPHTFRHAFGSHATMSGVNLRTLQDVMGHSSSQVTEIYTRLAATALSEEMKKFSLTTVVKSK